MGNEGLFDLTDIDDPSLGAVFRTSGKIVIVGLCVILFLMALQIFAIVELIIARDFLSVSRMPIGMDESFCVRAFFFSKD